MYTSDRAKASANVQEYAKISGRNGYDDTRKVIMDIRCPKRSTHATPSQQMEEAFTRDEYQKAHSQLKAGKASGPLQSMFESSANRCPAVSTSSVLNAQTWLASMVVITLLFVAGSIWWESPSMPSADCVVWKSIMQNTYGYNIRRFWWNDTIATLAIRWTKLSALHVQL